MIYQKFYSELGKFLYAICKADGKLQEKEIRTIERLVHHEISRHKHFHEKPEYKDIILTGLSFSRALREHITFRESQESFKLFLQQYGNHISSSMKESALALIRKTARASNGIGQEERKLIIEINDLMM